MPLPELPFPEHRFVTTLSDGSRFDTIVRLAVIEHLPQPERHLARWRSPVAEGGRLVLATPHPCVDIVHRVGARIGIFSRHASEEHQDLLDRGGLLRVATLTGLQVERYRRFFPGADQLAVLRAA